MLSVGAVLLYRRIRSKRRAKASASRDSMSTPMMSSFGRLNAPSTFSFHAPALNSPQTSYQPITRPPASPLSSYHDGSSSGGSSSSGHSVKSPMSEHSSAFHFPLLSKDGHLMPPVPASSWSIHDGDLGGAGGMAYGARPLPPAPGDEQYYEEQEQEYQYAQYTPDPYNVGPQAQPQLVAPTPTTPKRWSYVPPHSTPSPDRSDESVQQIVGLYPAIDFRSDGSLSGGQYEYSLDNASLRSSPRIAKVEDTFGFHLQPQSATYHRSFSAEGEQLRADR